MMELIVLLSCLFSFCAPSQLFCAEAFFMKTKECRGSDVVAALPCTVHVRTYVSHSFAEPIRRYSDYKFNTEITENDYILAT